MTSPRSMPRPAKRVWNRYLWFSWVDSAPAMDRNLLTIGSSDGLSVFAMDPATGRHRWAAFTGGWSWARPAIGKHTVYGGAVGSDMDYVGKRTGGLAAIDRDTGQLLWLFRPAHDPKALMSWICGRVGDRRRFGHCRRFGRQCLRVLRPTP